MNISCDDHSHLIQNISGINIQEYRSTGTFQSLFEVEKSIEESRNERGHYELERSKYALNSALVLGDVYCKIEGNVTWVRSNFARYMNDAMNFSK